MIDDGIARHNTRVLTVAQSLGGASPSIVISLGGLVGYTLAPDPQWSTVPVSLLQLGLATGTIPAALLMQYAGRRTGYIIGGLIGVMAGCIAALGIFSSLFWVFCLGTWSAGMFGSFVQSYRFAAIDAASVLFRPRAISLVMAGGIVAGVIGPQTVIWMRDIIPHAPFAGAFIGQALLAFSTIIIVSFLKPTPKPPIAKGDKGRPLRQIMANPRFIAAVVAGVVSYCTMSFLMTAAPIAMVACGYSVGYAAMGIQWHILAMFGPSLFTGRLISRFGKEAVAGFGLVLTACSAALFLGGEALFNFWGGLILLGIGWNFSFIGATALIADCYRPEERVKVQATNDFMIFGAVAVASFSSGSLLHSSGWHLVNIITFVPVAVGLALIGFLAWRRAASTAW